MTSLPSALPRSSRRRSAALVSLTAVAALALAGLTAPTAEAAPAAPAAAPVVPDLGPNVHVFDPTMPQADIQTTVDAVFAAQRTNQFGTRRDALLFLPGTYGSAADPLNFQVGYNTEVTGLGRNPGDVTVNGSINVYNQCENGNCIALNNFWRSMSNLTIAVTNDPADPQYSGCYSGEFWAVSQASPMRRVKVDGAMTLMDYCTGPSYASGGFLADSRISSTVVSGSQQQFIVRNSAIGGWSNGVWNQVFSGVTGAPAEAFASPNYYTTLATTPASKEKPYLYVDDAGVWQVFVPSAAAETSGATWSDTTDTPGTSIPLSQFYIAKPSDTATSINRKLAAGLNLLLTPGVYSIDNAITIKRAGTVVLGLGLATLTAASSRFVVNVGDVASVDIAGIVLDAGPVNSPTLMRIGSAAHAPVTGSGGATALQDVFFRIGGPHVGKATNSLIVNSDNVILDDIWAWRADHGEGVGWTVNTAATGVTVNGDNVTATGLFVEHYQAYEVIWRGQNGKVVFFQNELPYDVPNQAAWTSGSSIKGYAAFKLTNNVTSFHGYGMGSYSFFNQGVDIRASRAFETPRGPGIAFHDLLTIFLDPTNGSGGINHVINDTGGSSTKANPSTPVTVVDYPAVAAR